MQTLLNDTYIIPAACRQYCIMSLFFYSTAKKSFSYLVFLSCFQYKCLNILKSRCITKVDIMSCFMGKIIKLSEFLLKMVKEK